MKSLSKVFDMMILGGACGKGVRSRDGRKAAARDCLLRSGMEGGGTNTVDHMYASSVPSS